MTNQPTFTLGTAIRIAAEAHEGQSRRGGIPYIVHPMTVMTYVDTNAERMAAALHDVVEDCEPAVESERDELEWPHPMARRQAH